MTGTETTTAIGKRITTGKTTTDATRLTIEIMTIDGAGTSAAEMTTIAEATTIAAEIPTAEMIITAVTTITTERKIFGEVTTRNADNQGTTTGTTGRKMSARSDGDMRTIIDIDLDLQGPNHRDHKSSKNGRARTEGSPTYTVSIAKSQGTTHPNAPTSRKDPI